MQVQTKLIADSAITEGKINAGAVTSGKIGSGAVTTAKIDTGAVTASEIGAGAVTTAKIDTGAVTASELGAGAVTEAKIDTGAVTAGKIGSSAVTEAKINTGAVTADKIGTGAVTEAKIGTDAVTNAKIGTGAVDSDELAASSVIEAKIGTGAVTGAKIGTGAVTEAKIGTDAVTNAKIGTGAVDTDELAADAITSAKVADDQIDSEHYVAGSIDGEHLAADAKQSVLESKIDKFFSIAKDISAGSGTTVDVTDDIFSVANYPAVGGSSSVQGLVTTASHNKASIKDASTNDPIENASSQQVFGRVTTSETALTVATSITFTNNSTAVVGVGTTFSGELSAGSYIKNDTDGRYVKVATVTDNLNLVLDAVYPYETEVATAATKATLTLSFLVEAANDSEAAHTMGSETIDVMFPEAINLFDAPFGSLVSGIAFDESLSADHSHDDQYFTETEVGSVASATTSGAYLVGYYNSDSGLTATNVQDALDELADEHLVSNPRQETSTITVTNTIPNLTYTPRDVTAVQMYVFGVKQQYSTDFTVSGKAVTWNAVEFDIVAGDDVEFAYHSSD